MATFIKLKEVAIITLRMNAIDFVTVFTVGIVIDAIAKVKKAILVVAVITLIKNFMIDLVCERKDEVSFD